MEAPDGLYGDLGQEGGSPASLLRLRQEERPFSLIQVKKKMAIVQSDPSMIFR